MKPVIAITPEAITLPSRRDGRGSFCGVSYSEAVELAGGVPLIVPLTADRAVLDHFLETCDGWLFSGGGDVTGALYGLPKSELEKVKDADATRDEMEIYLLKRAAKRDLPVFGICRGIQAMNVAFGGTLIPHLDGHRNPKPDALAHPLEWAKPKHLVVCERVNTSHHQAIGRVADGFNVVARSPDNVIEAIEKSDARFFCGVQFHPERLVKVAPEFLRLFEALVNAARKR